MAYRVFGVQGVPLDFLEPLAGYLLMREGEGLDPPEAADAGQCSNYHN
jgi:hypothetical protein